MYTRGEFEQRRRAKERAQRRAAVPLLIGSVGLGVAQLLFITWADRRWARPAVLPWEVGCFLAYLVVVAWLLWRMQRRIRDARLLCPSCGARLSDLSERVAAATGRCDACGAQVIA